METLVVDLMMDLARQTMVDEHFDQVRLCLDALSCLYVNDQDPVAQIGFTMDILYKLGLEETKLMMHLSSLLGEYIF